MKPDDDIDLARRRLAALLLGTPLAGALQAAPAAPAPPADGGDFTARWVHAFAAYGPPKYGPDFTHFDYAEANAPKGGTLRLKNPDRRTSFDKFNPWTTRGNAPAGIFIWMVETLGHLCQDEPLTVYGLLAESMNVAPDFGSVTFRIRPEARVILTSGFGEDEVSKRFEGAGVSAFLQKPYTIDDLTAVLDRVVEPR